MAATPKTMAEVLASSPSVSSSSNIKSADNGDYANVVAGTAVVAENNNNNNIKEEHDSSSNIMIKTFPYLTITVYIPTACVGVLIGKRGSNIDSIQKLAAKESTKSQVSPRGGARGNNKSSKQQGKTNNNNTSNGGSGGNNPKAVSPESVRISVVNYPPPPPNAQHPQGFDQHYKNSIHHNANMGGESGTGAAASPTQGSSPMMDNMGVPPTYTELDFSDPQWTPIVIRADPIAAIYAANAIHDICCPEYVVDRNQLVYIMDVPVPAVASGNAHNGNLRHASIVGKRGNKLIQLSADHKCRIMVPPKQLGHNVIQLEAPLKECCSCLKAILGKLQAGSGNNDDREGQTEATKSLSPSKNSKNNNNSTKGNNNNNGNKKNDNGKNNFQMTLIIQPLPSQTKLRNIARKTETKILKKRIPKSQQQRNQKQTPPPQKQEQDPESKPSEPSADEAESGDPPQEKQDQGSNGNNNNNNGNSDNKVSWRLTVVATSEKKVMKAVDMLKVLNSKGYEVIVEESGPNNTVDTSSKSFVEGGLDDDADVGAGVDSSLNGGTVDGTKSGPTTNGNNGRGGGRGGRNKKQRHRNNHRGNNGKDNGSKPQQQPMTAPVAAVGDS